MNATKKRILDTAEKLFAEEGLAATSLRAITSQAGVNQAAIYYHFRTKEELVKAVFSRRVGPLNQYRQETLDQLLQGPELTLKKVLEAFITPLVELKDSRRNFARFVGRLLSEADEEKRQWIYNNFHELDKDFFIAISRAIPDCPRDRIARAGAMVLPSIYLIIVNYHVLSESACNHGVDLGDQVVTEDLVKMFSASIRAMI